MKNISSPKKSFGMRTLVLFFAALLTVGVAHAQIKVIASGNVGIGTSDPARPLEVVGQIMSTNFNTYPQNKQSNFLMRHHSNPNTHIAYFNASSDANNNQVLFGGGAGSQFAATNLAFMTAANNSTTLGTERMRVNNQGRVRISDTGGTISHDLTVYGTAAKDGGGDWLATSDLRLKTDVKDFTDGLEKVMQIRPVFFKYKDGMSGYDSRKEHVGIIAQEIQKVAPYTVQEVDFVPEWDDVNAPQFDKVLVYDGTAVRYMLINAIQEQQDIIETQDAKIEDLEARLAKIEAALSGNTLPGTTTSGIVSEQTVELSSKDQAHLQQNAPNPFTENTSISYYLPDDVTAAYIQIFDNSGSVIKNIPLDLTPGIGKLELKAKELGAGMYVYSLVVNNNIVDTKKMTLTK